MTKLLLLLIASIRAQERKYLVPLLLYGPNNQFSAILEGMAVAKLTGRTFVVPKYFGRWYRDGLSEPRTLFGDVFELEESFVGLARTEDIFDVYARKKSWAILASPVPKTRLRDAMTLLDLPCCPSKKGSTISSHSRARHLKSFFSQAPFRNATFVFVAPLFILDGEHGLLLEAAKSRNRSETIRHFAVQATDHFFGKKKNILAVHVRRESTDLGCDDERRYVVCPDLNRGVSTQEILTAILRAAHDSNATHIYLAYAKGNGPPELNRERETLVEALSQQHFIVASASDTLTMQEVELYLIFFRSAYRPSLLFLLLSEER